MRAGDFAGKAADLLVDRGVDRDQPDGERSMSRCVESFNAMTGHKLSEEDGWQFMVYLKFARMQGGSFRQDDYEDAVSYTALMAEAATAMQDAPVPGVEELSPDTIIWIKDRFTSLRDHFGIRQEDYS